MLPSKNIDQTARSRRPGSTERSEREEALNASVRLLRRLVWDLRRREREADQLMRVTTAIAEAMTPDQVFEAIVDETASVVGASSVALWLVDEERRVRLVRSLGYADEARDLFAEMPVDSKPRVPALDVIARSEPQFLGSKTELLELYPHLAHLVNDESSFNVACLPLQLHGRVFGALAFTFENAPPIDAERKTFLTLVARRSSQALERLHLLETERRTRERVEVLNGELQQIVRFNEMFTAILGHDLRNPLAAITTAAQLALNRKQSEKVSKPLTRILASSKRMARMIDQLLDYTRLRSGTGVPIEHSSTDIAQVVGQVIDELDDANPEWTLKLEHEGDTGGYWDADRLSQLFSNLVGNAVRHGTVAEGVLVRIDGSDRSAVSVSIHNGGAIHPDLLPNVFDPMMGGRERRARSQGLGLGLYISSQIARAHGGCIEVQSSTETGTTFTVSLPRGPTGAQGGLQT
jgi:signal transduction histidine kinase